MPCKQCGEHFGWFGDKYLKACSQCLEPYPGKYCKECKPNHHSSCRLLSIDERRMIVQSQPKSDADRTLSYKYYNLSDPQNPQIILDGATIRQLLKCIRQKGIFL